MLSPPQQQQNWGLQFAPSPANSHSSQVEASPPDTDSSQDSSIFLGFALALARRHLARNDDIIQHHMNEAEAWRYDYEEFNELLLSRENADVKKYL